MSGDDDEEHLKWDMCDDRQFVLRPGFKFPDAMTYKQMCQQVAMMVQKVGSDSVRPKVRKYVSLSGSKVPACVQFYCCHKRKHNKRLEPAKTADAARADRSQEGRSILLFSSRRQQQQQQQHQQQQQTDEGICYHTAA
jgi:hypothetical protein